MNPKIKELFLSGKKINFDLAFELSKSINGFFYKLIITAWKIQDRYREDNWQKSDRTREFCLNRLDFQFYNFDSTYEECDYIGSILDHFNVSYVLPF